MHAPGESAPLEPNLSGVSRLNNERLILSIAAIAIIAAIAFVSFGGIANAQTITGTILGTVVDPSGNIIIGATVMVVNEGTGDQRVASTNNSGSFVFASLPPALYTVRVENPGFQAYRRTGNQLSANDRLSLGDIQLAIGSVTDTVTVVAQGAEVQTASAEGSALLTTRQMETIAQRGRNVAGLLFLLPGVQSSGSEFEVAGNYDQLPAIGGVRNLYQTMSIDGMHGQDLGTSSAYTAPVSPDAVEEVKVLLNNYQAEYGRSGGAFINIVTKSGTRDFHGSAYWYKRHEMFNANNFFNNRNSLAKARYRYGTEGFTLGGPLTIPKVFNTGRQKLFFFYNYERNPSLQPSSIGQFTMPSALERDGNFSQTLDQSGKLMVIKDPTTGSPFPGNIIPPQRINRNGLALLNTFPLPNMLDRNITKGAYNYQFQYSTINSRDGHLFRVDYKATDKDSISFRGSKWESLSEESYITGWQFARNTFNFPTKHAVVGYTRILSASMVNEFTFGVRRPAEKTGIPYPNEVTRTGRGFLAGQFYPKNNWDDLMPQATFTGISNSPTFGNFQAGRFPQKETDTMFYFTDGLTINRHAHTIKVGAYAERDRIITGSGFLALPSGSFSFNVDPNNPIDSSHPYSNALIGNFASYTETSNRTRPAGIAINVDWYVQDSWKVARRLTLELGLRVAYYTPYTQWDGQQSTFSVQRYDKAKVPVFFQPTLVGGKRIALNPLTGSTASAAWIGAFVPGTGDPANGMVRTYDGNYPTGFWYNAGEMFQPRFGLAWDVFGNGKTAVRAGFAKFNQLLRFEPRSATAPISYQPTVYYDNLDTFLSAASVLSPGAVIGHDLYMKAPNTYNLTLGIQQDIGFGTVLETKYVGVLGRNLSVTRNINTLPYGVRFQAENVDPTTSRPFADNFLRPYRGYGDITYRDTGGSSNYHSLQVTANRRLAAGLQFGGAYTYSKTMDYGTLMPLYVAYRTYAYSLADFDQTHNLVINYTYDIPPLSKLVSHPVVKFAFDHWQISGVTRFASGTPSGISVTTTTSADMLGGGNSGQVVDGVSGSTSAQRANVVSDPHLSHGERGLLRMFNTAAFALPAKGDPGNAARMMVRGPGVNNWDMTMFKNFPLRSEQRSVQLRWEFYNLFNHTQFSSMNTTARFDPATGAQTNGQFGQATAARTPRMMQVSLRFRF